MAANVTIQLEAQNKTETAFKRVEQSIGKIDAEVQKLTGNNQKLRTQNSQLTKEALSASEKRRAEIRNLQNANRATISLNRAEIEGLRLKRRVQKASFDSFKRQLSEEQRLRKYHQRLVINSRRAEERAAERAARATREAARAAEANSSGLLDMASALTQVSSSLARVGDFGARQLAGFIQAGADIERRRSAFISLFKSTEKADEAITKLRKAAQDPGLTFQVAAKGAQLFGSLNISIDDSIHLMRGLANSAALSGTSVDQLSEGARQLFQALARGKLEQEDLNSLTERFGYISRYLRENYANTAEEINAKLKETGKTVFDLAKEITSLEHAPRASADTLANAFSNLDNAVQQAKQAIGTQIVPEVKVLTGVLTNLVNKFNDLPDPIKKATAALAALTVVGGKGAAGLIELGANIGIISVALKSAGGLAGAAAAASAAIATVGGALAVAAPYLIAATAAVGGLYVAYNLLTDPLKEVHETLDHRALINLSPARRVLRETGVEIRNATRASRRNVAELQREFDKATRAVEEYDKAIGKAFSAGRNIPVGERAALVEKLAQAEKELEAARNQATANLQETTFEIRGKALREELKLVEAAAAELQNLIAGSRTLPTDSPLAERGIRGASVELSAALSEAREQAITQLKEYENAIYNLKKELKSLTEAQEEALKKAVPETFEKNLKAVDAAFKALPKSVSDIDRRLAKVAAGDGPLAKVLKETQAITNEWKNLSKEVVKSQMAALREASRAAAEIRGVFDAGEAPSSEERGIHRSTENRERDRFESERNQGIAPIEVRERENLIVGEGFDRGKAFEYLRKYADKYLEASKSALDIQKEILDSAKELAKLRGESTPGITIKVPSVTEGFAGSDSVTDGIEEIGALAPDALPPPDFEEFKRQFTMPAKKIFARYSVLFKDLRDETVAAGRRFNKENKGDARSVFENIKARFKAAQERAIEIDRGRQDFAQDALREVYDRQQVGRDLGGIVSNAVSDIGAIPSNLLEIHQQQADRLREIEEKLADDISDIRQNSELSQRERIRRIADAEADAARRRKDLEQDVNRAKSQAYTDFIQNALRDLARLIAAEVRAAVIRRTVAIVEQSLAPTLSAAALTLGTGGTAGVGFAAAAGLQLLASSFHNPANDAAARHAGFRAAQAELRNSPRGFGATSAKDLIEHTTTGVREGLNATNSEASGDASGPREMAMTGTFNLNLGNGNFVRLVGESLIVEQERGTLPRFKV